MLSVMARLSGWKTASLAADELADPDPWRGATSDAAAETEAWRGAASAAPAAPRPGPPPPGAAASPLSEPLQAGRSCSSDAVEGPSVEGPLPARPDRSRECCLAWGRCEAGRRGRGCRRARG
jgi:hypothetical protein